MALYKTLFYFLTSLAPLQGTGRLDAYDKSLSKERNYTKGKIQDRIRRAEEKIAAYLEELEQTDKTEAEEQVKAIEAAILALVELRTELEGYLERVTCGEETQVSLTDPDSRLMKTKGGMSVSLNIQTDTV